MTLTQSLEYSSESSMFSGSSKSQRSVNSEFMPKITSLSLRVGIQPIPSMELRRRRDRQTSPAAKMYHKFHKISHNTILLRFSQVKQLTRDVGVKDLCETFDFWRHHVVVFINCDEKPELSVLPQAFVR